MHFSFLVRRKKRGVEDVVYFPGGGYALGSYPCNKENGETLVELWGTEL